MKSAPNEKYACRECVNQATPLCEKCLTITRPSGTESKPTLFVKDTAGMIHGCTRNMRAIQSTIADSVMMSVPIPVAAVLAYNEALEKVRDKQDKT